MKSEKFENKEMKKAAGMVRVGAILVVVALIGLLVMGVSSCGGSDKDIPVPMNHEVLQMKSIPVSCHGMFR